MMITKNGMPNYGMYALYTFISIIAILLVVSGIRYLIYNITTLNLIIFILTIMIIPSMIRRFAQFISEGKNKLSPKYRILVGIIIYLLIYVIGIMLDFFMHIPQGNAIYSGITDMIIFIVLLYIILPSSKSDILSND